ncbi:DeoR family transcriptional regulator, partial [Frederiksenia canicola]
MKKNELLARRLGDILSQLSQGTRIDVHSLAEDFDVSIRTIQRDINDRLTFLEWKEQGPRYYQLNLAKLGILTEQDIKRFATFASVAELFPKLDREFFQNKLTESIQVKGFEYENISHLQKEFKLLNQAIEKQQYIHFNYIKNGQITGNFYQIAPYALINKNG